MRVAVRFGANLRAVREASGLTCEAVSSRGRFQLPAITLFENGQAMPDMEQLVKLASILDTSPNALLAGIRWDQDQMRFVVEPPADETG